MKRLSSRATPLLKWALPLGWMVVTATVGALAWLDPHRDLFALAVVCFLPVFLAILYRFQIWPLADVVEDAGDALLVRRRGVELRVPLADIVNISVPNYSRTRKVTLRLRRAGQLGDEIVFLPVTRLRWNPFARDPLVEDLISRVDAARSGAAR